MAKLSRPWHMDVRNTRTHLTFIGNWVVRFTKYDSLQSSLQPWCPQLLKYFAHKLCLIIAQCTTSIDNSLFHEAAPAFQTWRSLSSFSVNLPWTARGFVCNVSISLSFPAPTSLAVLNLNNKKIIEWIMIESLRTTQIAFFRFATPSGFPRGVGDEVQKVVLQGSV